MIDANGNRAELRYDGYDRQTRWVFPSKTRPTAFNPSTQATALNTAGAINEGDYEEYSYDANLFKQAMGGNQAAIREINRLIEKAQLSQQALERAEAEAAEKAAQEKAKSDAAWFGYIVEFKIKRTKAWADAEAQGKDEPDEPWPHPDDILIDHAERKAWVRGPWCEKDVRYFEYLEALRDLMFLRDMIHLKTCKISEIRGMTLWEALWRLLDAKLPLDWQLAHKASAYQLGCLNAPVRTLRRKADELSRLIDETEPPECKVRVKGTYKLVNTVMKPILQRHGYKSLAHFERVAGREIAA